MELSDFTKAMKKSIMLEGVNSHLESLEGVSFEDLWLLQSTGNGEQAELQRCLEYQMCLQEQPFWFYSDKISKQKELSSHCAASIPLETHVQCHMDNHVKVFQSLSQTNHDLSPYLAIDKTYKAVF